VSKVKSCETGTPNRAENTSRFSNDGAFMPRSIRLKKSTEISSNSANSSWLFFLDRRIDRMRLPNFSRRLVN